MSTLSIMIIAWCVYFAFVKHMDDRQ